MMISRFVRAWARGALDLFGDQLPPSAALFRRRRAASRARWPICFNSPCGTPLGKAYCRGSRHPLRCRAAHCQGEKQCPFTRPRLSTRLPSLGTWKSALRQIGANVTLHDGVRVGAHGIVSGETLLGGLRSMRMP